MNSILFVCVGNACRSQMAEGFARKQAPEGTVVYSAGSHPLGHLIQETIEAMKEKGIDLSRHTSKGISDVPDIQYDAVVTMGCGDACQYVRAKKRFDWQIPDPVGQTPEFFRKTRDLIECKVQELLNFLRGS